jgi:hypothetical protein
MSINTRTALMQTAVYWVVVHHIVWQKFIDVSEVLAASIIREITKHYNQEAIFIFTTMRTSYPTQV